MPYRLFFKSNEGVPSVGLQMPRQEWDNVAFTNPKGSPLAAAYLGSNCPWHDMGARAVGYDKAARVDAMRHYVDVLFPLHTRTIFATILTMSVILQDLDGWQRNYLPGKTHLSVTLERRGTFTIWGIVSPSFQDALATLAPQETDRIVSNMRKTWRSSAPFHSRRADDFGLEVTDGRFMLRCPGASAGLYPECGPVLESRGVASPHQTATLMAGLASLHQAIRLPS